MGVFGGGRGANKWSNTGTYENRFCTLNTESDGDTWHEVGRGKSKNKRQRRSTGGTYERYEQESGSGPSHWGQNAQFQIMDKEVFRGLSTDDKLVTMFKTLTDIGSLHGRVQNIERQVENLVVSDSVQNDRLRLIEYKSIDMEARSRRNNLIFRGHPESVENDDCVAIIRHWLPERLGLRPDICIQRAHRLGNPKRNRRNRGGGARPQPRPTIVNFRDYEDVELILENANKLKDTSFRVNRDYPKEIVSARSKIWPAYKKAREENARGTVHIGYPAKLIVHKRVVLDEFPDWRNVLRGSRMQENQGPNVAPNEVASGRNNQPRDQVVDTDNQRIPPKTQKFIIEIGNENDDGSVDEVASMASEKSRSSSRSRSPAGDHIDTYLRDELLAIAANIDKARETTSASASSDKTKVNENGKHDSAKQSEQHSKDENEGLSAYDLSMKRLESHTERITRPSDKSKTDTGQINSQNQLK